MVAATCRCSMSSYCLEKKNFLSHQEGFTQLDSTNSNSRGCGLLAAPSSTKVHRHLPHSATFTFARSFASLETEDKDAADHVVDKHTAQPTPAREKDPNFHAHDLRRVLDSYDGREESIRSTFVRMYKHAVATDTAGRKLHGNRWRRAVAKNGLDDLPVKQWRLFRRDLAAAIQRTFIDGDGDDDEQALDGGGDAHASATRLSDAHVTQVLHLLQILGRKYVGDDEDNWDDERDLSNDTDRQQLKKHGYFRVYNPKGPSPDYSPGRCRSATLDTISKALCQNAERKMQRARKLDVAYKELEEIGGEANLTTVREAAETFNRLKNPRAFESRNKREMRQFFSSYVLALMAFGSLHYHPTPRDLDLICAMLLGPAGNEFDDHANRTALPQWIERAEVMTQNHLAMILIALRRIAVTKQSRTLYRFQQIATDLVEKAFAELDASPEASATSREGASHGDEPNFDNARVVSPFKRHFLHAEEPLQIMTELRHLRFAHVSPALLSPLTELWRRLPLAEDSHHLNKRAKPIRPLVHALGVIHSCAMLQFEPSDEVFEHVYALVSRATKEAGREMTPETAIYLLHGHARLGRKPSPEFLAQLREVLLKHFKEHDELAMDRSALPTSNFVFGHDLETDGQPGGKSSKFSVDPIKGHALTLWSYAALGLPKDDELFNPMFASLNRLFPMMETENTGMRNVRLPNMGQLHTALLFYGDELVKQLLPSLQMELFGANFGLRSQRAQRAVERTYHANSIQHWIVQYAEMYGDTCEMQGSLANPTDMGLRCDILYTPSSLLDVPVAIQFDVRGNFVRTGNLKVNDDEEHPTQRDYETRPSGSTLLRDSLFDLYHAKEYAVWLVDFADWQAVVESKNEENIYDFVYRGLDSARRAYARAHDASK